MPIALFRTPRPFGGSPSFRMTGPWPRMLRRRDENWVCRRAPGQLGFPRPVFEDRGFVPGGSTVSTCDPRCRAL